MKNNYIFVLNCGSSSVKFAIIDQNNHTHICHGMIANINRDNCHINYIFKNEIYGEHISDNSYHNALLTIINLVKQDQVIFNNIIAIGHRVVHGGNIFKHPAIIGKHNLNELKQLFELAPLHNPINFLGIEECLLAFSSIPNVAVFDTSFHSTIPDYAKVIPIKQSIAKQYKVTKYGFHGISHTYITQTLSKHLNKDKINIISAHLGSGCSIAAIKDSKSVDTTMSFTPTSGIMMATRSGDIDPLLHKYLMTKMNLDITEFSTLLSTQSGILGISEISSDMRDIEAEYKKGNKNAILALEAFCYQVAKNIASLMVPLIKCDAIVFTAGIGENSALTRKKILDYLKFLHILICNKANEANNKEIVKITLKESAISCYVIKTSEEIMIATTTLEVILNPINSENKT
jgi:acetate kinase